MSRSIIIAKSNKFLENFLKDKLDIEVVNSVAQFSSEYNNKYVRIDKLVIVDGIFSDDSNILNDMEHILEVISVRYFRFDKVHFMVSNYKDKIGLIQIIESVFQDIQDKFEINRFPSHISAFDILSVITNRKNIKEEVMNTYEEVIKKVRDTSAEDKSIQQLQYDSPNQTILNTTDYSDLLQYNSIKRLLRDAKGDATVLEGEDQTVLFEDPSSIIENISNTESKVDLTDNEALIIGERSSGKFTLTMALALSLFQGGKSTVVFDLTDSSSFRELENVNIDTNIIDVNDLKSNPGIMGEHIKSIKEKMITVITGNPSKVFEYSFLIKNVIKHNFGMVDYILYTTNITRFELVTNLNCNKILVTTSSMDKYLKSCTNLVISKLKNNVRNANIKIIPNKMHSVLWEDNVNTELLGECADRIFRELECEENNVNLTIISPPIKITNLNMEAQFAKDMIGGVV